MPNDSSMNISSYTHAPKHYCPKCIEALKPITVGNISKRLDPYGDLKSYRTEFQCPKCRLSFTLEDLRKIEQSTKKK